MTTKEDIEKVLLETNVFDQELIKFWWRSEIAGLGKARPIDLFEKGEADRLLEYAKGYVVV